MIFESFFQSEKIPTLLKWAITLVVTGFIAQFGKRLADFIIQKIRERRHKKRRLPVPDSSSLKISRKESTPVIPPIPPDKKVAKEEHKRMKKIHKARAKAEKKKAKNTG